MIDTPIVPPIQEKKIWMLFGLGGEFESVNDRKRIGFFSWRIYAVILPLRKRSQIAAVGMIQNVF